ncbi:MAG: HEPN domain-containing protein [Gemmatimonadales bacterium]|nr:HEPN domain-containing protein [Gemmatimonadales bacterium]
MRKARLDLDAGTFELANLALLGDVVFHAQQAAEKSFKALLAWHDIPFRKTHDLGAIGGACLEIDASLRQLVDGAVHLTPYAWKFRYPGGQVAIEELFPRAIALGSIEAGQ